jgi:hypothetical protein
MDAICSVPPGSWLACQTWCQVGDEVSSAFTKKTLQALQDAALAADAAPAAIPSVPAPLPVAPGPDNDVSGKCNCQPQNG